MHDLFNVVAQDCKQGIANKVDKKMCIGPACPLCENIALLYYCCHTGNHFLMTESCTIGNNAAWAPCSETDDDLFRHLKTC
jgi:hypothetical protein